MDLNCTELNKKFMTLALNQAQIAFNLKEVPVGAVIVRNKKIVSAAYNRREKFNSCLAHAELIAIKLACKKLRNWRLLDCKIYVTLQPCVMCVEAIAQSRIKHVFFASKRIEKENFLDTEIFTQICLKNNIKVTSGIEAQRSQELLSIFFQKIRNKNQILK